MVSRVHETFFRIGHRWSANKPDYTCVFAVSGASSDVHVEKVAAARFS